MAFSFIYIAGIIGAMYGWGMSKGWSASNPILWPNQDRFWPKVGQLLYIYLSRRSF
jgi:hypothetical protein